jgi:hypothetical protein
LCVGVLVLREELNKLKESLRLDVQQEIAKVVVIF